MAKEYSVTENGELKVTVSQTVIELYRYRHLLQNKARIEAVLAGLQEELIEADNLIDQADILGLKK